MNKNIEKFLAYLRTNGLEKLVSQYNIRVNQHNIHNELVSLCYHHTKSPKADIPNVCRGIVINRNTFEIIAMPFERFFDLDEKSKVFDFSNFKRYEKVDGSLVSLYYYKDKWHIATKGTPDGSGEILGLEKTYSEYFFEVFGEDWFPLLDFNKTYIFEFKFPSDIQFITYCDKPSITLIGLRNNETLEEEIIENSWLTEFGFTIPMGYNYLGNAYDNLVSLKEAYSYYNPLIMEGYVIVDNNFNRMKVKHPGYELISNLMSSDSEDAEVANLKTLIKLSQFVTNVNALDKKFPHLKETFGKILKARKHLINELNSLKVKLKDKDKKSVGLMAKNHKFGNFLFVLHDTNFAFYRPSLAELALEKAKPEIYSKMIKLFM